MDGTAFTVFHNFTSVCAVSEEFYTGGGDSHSPRPSLLVIFYDTQRICWRYSFVIARHHKAIVVNTPQKKKNVSSEISKHLGSICPWEKMNTEILCILIGHLRTVTLSWGKWVDLIRKLFLNLVYGEFNLEIGSACKQESPGTLYAC